jgi:predicted transcriptional regulator
MNEPIRRTDTVKIKLSPDILARLEDQARAFGMPPSTLCAFAVADWLNRQDQNQKLARMAVLDATRSSLPDQEAMMAALEAAMPAAMKALAQTNLPLDGEAANGAA